MNGFLDSSSLAIGGRSYYGTVLSLVFFDVTLYIYIFFILRIRSTMKELVQVAAP